MRENRPPLLRRPANGECICVVAHCGSNASLSGEKEPELVEKNIDKQLIYLAQLPATETQAGTIHSTLSTTNDKKITYANWSVVSSDANPGMLELRKMSASDE